MKRWADFHCDVLSKLLTGEAEQFAGEGAVKLDVTYERLQAAGADLQNFAIYLPERMPKKFDRVLQAVDLFHRHILTKPGVSFVRTSEDLIEANKQGRMAAMLSLEGAEGLEGDLTSLRILYYLGVRSVGITWNHANWAGDGVLEPRQGGLTEQGRELIKVCNELGILIDVSHLAEKGFWEAADLSAKPIIASHSNARSVLDHPRNLTDDQIRAIIARDGLIGITFVPWFVKRDPVVKMEDLLPHIERVCSLGGERNLMLGSDFDGIDRHIEQLTNPTETPMLLEQLDRRFGDRIARGIARENVWSFLRRHLPTRSA
jgi:membrane dipeptidase